MSRERGSKYISGEGEGGGIRVIINSLESSLPSPIFKFPFRIDITVEFLGRLERRAGSSFLLRHFRAVPTTRTSSFIRPGRVRSVPRELRARAYPEIHDVTKKKKNC